MADKQDEWLDKEAAERLLRRQPVDPADGRPRQEAETLAAALDAAARTARPATDELPGEAAALAAFRAVPRTATRTRSASARADRATGAGSAGSDEAGALAPVHIGPVASGTASGAAGSRGAGPLRWSRPIRFGLVASLACCAIGGVAVAAGTGVLPGPFGHTPAPATSVSAAASPGELGSDLTADDETSAPPSGSPDSETPSPDASGSAGTDDDRNTARPGGSGPTGQETEGNDSSAGASNGTANGSSDGADATHGSDGDSQPGDSKDDTSGAWYAKTLKACRDYRDGKLDDDRRRRLEALAKGARNLDRFCDRMLDKAADNDSGSQSGGSQSGDSSEPGGDDDSATRGSGSLPSIDFSLASPVPTVASTGADPDPADSTDAQSPAPEGLAEAR